VKSDKGKRERALWSRDAALSIGMAVDYILRRMPS
jgi:hypothetical protein